MNDETAEGPITEIPNKLQIQRALRRVTQRQTIIRVGANCEDWPRLPPQPPSNNSNMKDEGIHPDPDCDSPIRTGTSAQPLGHNALPGVAVAMA